VSPQIEEDHFFVRKNSIWHATPLFVALALIEVSDIVFALDSVPAIFAITKEPLLVFTSNIFAILGLRAMFFMLAGIIHKFHLLKYGLGFVLIFVGLKMSWLNDLYDGKFPIWLSLLVIAIFIFGSIAMSLIFPPKVEPTNR
jgi:tellurite resistance protein TerC